jgi:beta-lactamase class A
VGCVGHAIYLRARAGNHMTCGYCGFTGTVFEFIQVGATVMTVNDRALPTTALDLAQLMTAIAAGQGVTPASRDEMLSLLAQEWFREGVVAGVPEGTTLAHKSGRFDAATHDAAVVWGPDGPYVITVLTDGSGAWAPIAAISAAVWQYFETSP